MEISLKGWNWKPPAGWQVIETIDMHTSGEPLRIVTGGLPEIPGKTILEKSSYFREHYDQIRKGLMWEPRGHADMYGAIITDAVTPDGDFGVFFIHNEGYSSMCGHAIIALTTLIYQTGFLNISSNKPFLNIDSPSGRIRAGAKINRGRIEEVFFENVPSFVLAEKEVLEIEGIGDISIDIAFGGAFYAFTEAEPLGLSLNEKDYYKMIDIGRRIKQATSSRFEIKHPFVEGLSFLYGTIFTGRSGKNDVHSRNVCIFADGEVDRSPTGTGVSARAAIHFQRGELKPGDKITIESIIGTTMGVKVKEQIDYGPFKAIIPEVSGRAFITGRNGFYFDPEDDLGEGFIFR